MSAQEDAENDFVVLSELSAEVATDYVDETADDWEESPFNWIYRIPSPSTKGKIGKGLVKSWAARAGFTVEPHTSREHDTILSGRKIGVKFSLRWESGEFVFQQIRDQDYELAALLGLQPQSASLWIVPKQILMENSGGQHGGGDSHETSWLRFSASDPPEWLREFGGSLKQAQKSLEQAS